VYASVGPVAGVFSLLLLLVVMTIAACGGSGESPDSF
jgi:hypothetical protein